MSGTLPAFQIEKLGASATENKSALVRVYPAVARGALTELRGPRMTIGRDPLCDIELRDDFASRIHALLELRTDGWFLCDRGSLNGTTINDVKVEEHQLQPHDEIRVGNHIFRFLCSDHLSAQYDEVMYEMMTLDALTDTFNRRYFEQMFAWETVRSVRHHRPLGLLLIDVDAFTQINDVYGHLVGDEVLRALGRRLRGRTRAHELLARVGGEKFAVALPEASLENVKKVADDYRTLVSDAPFETTRGPVELTASVGVAYCTGTEQVTGEDLIAIAEQKLADAKRNDGDAVKS